MWQTIEAKVSKASVQTTTASSLDEDEVKNVYDHHTSKVRVELVDVMDHQGMYTRNGEE